MKQKISGPSRSGASIKLSVEDLAPGDRKALELNIDDLQFHRVIDPDDPLLQLGHEMLLGDFGRGRGVPPIEMFRRRLSWDPAETLRNHSFLYEMIVVTDGEQPIAMRDH